MKQESLDEKALAVAIATWPKPWEEYRLGEAIERAIRAYLASAPAPTVSGELIDAEKIIEAVNNDCYSHNDGQTGSMGEDGENIIRGLVERLNRASPAPTVSGEAKPVAWAGTMPGTDGFTMAVFRAETVPVGTALYLHPAPTRDDAATIERWKQRGKDTTQASWAALRMIRDATEELFGPAASLESGEAVLLRGPEYHHEAEAIIDALKRVAATIERLTRELAELEAMYQRQGLEAFKPFQAEKVRAEAAESALAKAQQERDESARSWRDAFDGMHQRAMTAEAENRSLSTELAKAQQERDIAQGNTDAAIADYNDALRELARVREALTSIAGARMLVGADWEGFAVSLQNIARTALSPAKPSTGKLPTSSTKADDSDDTSPPTDKEDRS